MIPVCEPTLDSKELELVTKAVKSGWISSSGKYIKQFEEKFADYCGVKYGVACTSGTTALHLAIEVLKIGQGDEIITPTFSMAATTNAILYAGAKPVFVDSELETWNLDINQIENSITSRTKAIMVVHTFGHPVDMDKVNKIALKYGLKVIEDAAEAHGAEYKGEKTGGLGDIACFSFYANKIITTGEGGMVLTDNIDYAERARKLRNHYFGVPRFLHKEIGFNYRLTNIQAALGCAQLEKIGYLVDSRRNNASIYSDLLKNIEGVVLPSEMGWAKNVYWMYGILIEKEFGFTMQQLRKKLFDRGIETRAFFIGMHKQPAYNKNFDNYPDKVDCPIADQLEEKGLYLPSSSHLTKNEIKLIVKQILTIKNNI